MKKLKVRKIKKFLPKKIQTRQAGYLGLALLIIFSLFTYDIFFRSPKVKAATITTSSDSTALGNVTQRHSVITSKGVIVAFLDTGTQGVTGIAYSTSSDNGATWSGPVQVDSTQSGDFSVTVDSLDNIYMVINSSGSLTFRTLSYASGSWSISAASSILAKSSCPSTPVSYSAPSIAINSNGVIEVAANKQGGTCSPLSITSSTVCVYSVDHSTWNTMTGGPTNDGTSPPTNIPLASDGVSIWSVQSAGNAGTSTYGLYVDVAGSGTWSLATTLPAFTRATLAYGLDSMQIFFSTSTGLAYQSYAIESGSLSSFTPISSSANDVLGTIITDSQNVWAVYQNYVGSSSYNVVYKRFNGTSWDSSPTNITTDNANNTNISAPARTPNTANVPVLWSSGTTSPYTIKAAIFSTTGSVTDTGNQTGSYTGTLTGSSGDTIVKCGTWYYNTVNIVSGMTVKVCANNGQTGGQLTIYANSVTVAGTIDGAGRGMPGGVSIYGVGGAGGAGGNPNSAGSAGSAGTNSAGGKGSGNYAGLGGTAGTNSAGAAAGGTAPSVLGTGTGGGGGGGGSGSTTTAGGSGTLGGYLGGGTNGDTSTDESLVFGSGGGGGGSGGSAAGGGGGGGGANGTPPALAFAGGNGGNGGKGGKGGKGGDGGAIVKIYASGNLAVSGSIIITGQAAGTAAGGTAGSAGAAGLQGCGSGLC